MKKLGLKICLIILLIALPILLLLYLFPYKKPINDFLGGIEIKEKRIKAIKGKKIIVVGGSNLAFGIDTKMLSDSIGIPVANMGIHGGIGVPLNLKIAKQNAKDGDIILLAFEYFIGDGWQPLIEEAINAYPDFRKYTYSDNYFEIKTKEYEYASKILLERVNHVQYLVQRRRYDTSNVNANANKVYCKKCFNSYGDIIVHLDIQGTGPQFDPNTPDMVDFPHYVSVFENYRNEMKLKNVDVIFSFVPYPKSVFVNYEKTLRNYDLLLHHNTSLPFINQMDDILYADSLFYDSNFHLNKTGREKRTKQLIEGFRKYIKNKI